MATIKEIADIAGVSRGTVDRVLNKRGAVKPATEAKILEIAKVLKYEPNKAGIALAAQKKNLKLGVIMFGIGNPFFEDVINGFHDKEKELQSYKCTVIMKRISAFGIEDQLRAIDELLEQNISGLALSPQNDPLIKSRIDELYDMGIPTVTFNTDIEGSKRIAYVGSNYYECGLTAAALLHMMFDKDMNIGIIGGFNNVLCHTERIRGFRSKMENFSNVTIIDEILVEDDDFISFEKTKQMLNSHPEINALFFAAGGSLGGCKAAMSLNLANDIKIITFDKTASTIELLNQNVINATICQQPYKQGYLPLQILVENILLDKTPHTEAFYTDIEIKIKENIH